MKKSLIIAIIAILLSLGVGAWAFYTVQQQNEVIEELRGEDEVIEEEEEDDEDESDIMEPEEPEETEEEEVEEEEPEEEEEPIVEPYTGANYITLNSPKPDAVLHDLPVEFRGVVSPNTTKIVVTGTGGVVCEPDMMCISPYYEDIYRLQSFNYGDSSFVYRADMKWDNLVWGTNRYKFDAYFDDGTVKSTNVTISFVQAGAEMGKPVIYLYPEETTKVSVNVEPTGGFSITEPEIAEDGWSVLASPTGEILNYGDLKFYPYLFWEGNVSDYSTPDEGFMVAREELDDFFSEKLSYMGMNEIEIADFEEFWLPLMQEDPYYFVSFIPQDEFDDYAPLDITPEPDTVIRVIFDHIGLDEPKKVIEQELIKGVREGFTVIEWGGKLY